MKGNQKSVSKRREKKQVGRRSPDWLSHDEAEAAVPEDLAVLGEEDAGVGIEHWRTDDGTETDDTEQ